jgi:kojibiose phosphorylase
MKNHKIRFSDISRQNLNLRESLFTLSNTYMGMRGVEDEIPDGSLPGCYLAGVFNQSESLVSEIVNFPSMLGVYIVLEGQKICLNNAKTLSYERVLDMSENRVERTVVFETTGGARFQVHSQRFLSHFDVHCGAVEYTVTPLNFSGPLEICSEIDASKPSRLGGYSYDESIQHYVLEQINDPFEEDQYLCVRLRDSGELVDFASHFTVLNDNAINRRRKLFGARSVETIKVQAIEGKSLLFRKMFVVVDSRNVRVERLRSLSSGKLQRLKVNGFAAELQRSNEILAQKWQHANVEIDGDDAIDQAVRFNVHQLISLGHDESADFAIGAKGLSTEIYGGHYFWDTEIYLVPFYLYTNPAVARNLLLFRYHTLDKAKARAADQGWRGCLWPWQSDANGNEGIRQTVLDNGVIERRAILDQYHIVSDVAYASFRYLSQTGERSFFVRYLTPLIVEALRFWQSYLEAHNPGNPETLHIPKVMGPDEYHVNVDDNFYTNYLARYVFSEFFSFWKNCSDKERFDIGRDNHLDEVELDSLQNVGRRIYLPKPREGVIEQFAGYFDLRDMTITRFSEKGLPVYPHEEVGKGLDHAEQQDAYQQDATTTQLIKQADVVLAFCLNPSDFDAEIVEKSVRYYLDRTLQFSSLSPGNYGLAAALAGYREDAQRLFKICAFMDLNDIKNETAKGLHTACHGSAYQNVVEGFAGISVRNGIIEINPRLPDGWRKIRVPFFCNRNRFVADINKDGWSIKPLQPATFAVRNGHEIMHFTNHTDPVSGLGA